MKTKTKDQTVLEAQLNLLLLILGMNPGSQEVIFKACNTFFAWLVKNVKAIENKGILPVLVKSKEASEVYAAISVVVLAIGVWYGIPEEVIKPVLAPLGTVLIGVFVKNYEGLLALSFGGVNLGALLLVWLVATVVYRNKDKAAMCRICKMGKIVFTAVGQCLISVQKKIRTACQKNASYLEKLLYKKRWPKTDTDETSPTGGEPKRANDFNVNNNKLCEKEKTGETHGREGVTTTSGHTAFRTTNDPTTLVV